MIRATLCFVFEGNPHHKILLGYKKRGFGQGKFGGFGGKTQDGESLQETASCELYEGSGISTNSSDLTPLGVLTFIFPYTHSWEQEVHVFVAHQWHGMPSESEEMSPEWFMLTDIPYEQMWDDTRYWLPHILGGEQIDAVFTMNQDNETVKGYTLRTI